MRRRVIDPTFWSDSRLGKMPQYTKLVYIGAWSYADDEGFYKEDYEEMGAVLFPYSPHFDIKSRIEELINNGCIRVWVNNDRRYHEIIKFKEWQTISHPTPSKIKPILEKSGKLLTPLESSPQVKLSQVKLSKVNKNNISQIENLLKSFSDQIQKNIKIYWDRARLKNKSRIITDGRRLTMLNELYNSRQRCNDDSLFNYALEQTITHDAPCIGYVDKVWLNKKTKKPL